MRSLVAWTALAALLIGSGRASAECTVSHMTPSGTITPTVNGQRFAFTATGDCVNFRLSIASKNHGLSNHAEPAPRTGPGPQWYSVRVPLYLLEYVTQPGIMKLEWSIYDELDAGKWELAATMTNELDMDGDGATRTDGDDLLCDADPTRSPFFPEICGNRIDDDCDGVSLECTSGRDLSPDDAWVTLSGVRPGQRLGARVAPAGDVNGDGVGDVTVAPQSGPTFLFLGPPTNGTTDDADALFVIPERYDGTETRGIGDQNHDGFGDLLVSNAEYHDRGASFVLLGPVTGPVDVEADAVATLTSPWLEGGFGPSAAGDIDGDGNADLVIGAPLVRYAGAAYVFYGPITSGVLDLSDAGATVRGTYWDTEGQRGWTGGTVASNGDVDGDGIDEVVVGSMGSGYKGIATLLFGPVRGTFADYGGDVLFDGAPYDALFGRSLSIAGDLTGDGLDDLVIGTTSTWGGVAVFYGDTIEGATELGVSDADASIAGDEHSGLGWALDAGGDLNADGSDDLVVGAYLTDDLDGATYGFYGPVAGVLSSADASVALTAPGERRGIGISVGFVGDVGGGGADDLAVGAMWGGTRPETEEGEVYLFRGGAL